MGRCSCGYSTPFLWEGRVLQLGIPKGSLKTASLIPCGALNAGASTVALTPTEGEGSGVEICRYTPLGKYVSALCLSDFERPNPGANKMAQQVRALATEPDNLSLTPGSSHGRRESTLTGCPLASTCVVCTCCCTHRPLNPQIRDKLMWVKSPSSPESCWCHPHGHLGSSCRWLCP